MPHPLKSIILSYFINYGEKLRCNLLCGVLNTQPRRPRVRMLNMRLYHTFFDNTYVVLFRRIRFDKAFDRTSEHDLELS